MRVLKGIGKWLWRFMVVFSFIVNIVLVVVLLLAGIFIFQIKGQVADPLIGGLHSTAAGLYSATIDRTIAVRDSLGIALDVPINANTITSVVTELNGAPVEPIAGETVVTLTRAVPLTINNAFIQSNDLTLRNATVQITLPAGTRLPVALDLQVSLVTDIPVDLDVRAVIPIAETQLADPINTLGLLFEPLAIALHNLPNDFNQAGDLVGRVFGGAALDQLLLATDGTGFNPAPYIPWRGYSQTAGLNYDLFDEAVPQASQSIATGIVAPGGIPALDALIRPELYQDGATPATLNAQAIQNLEASGVPAYGWNGSASAYYESMRAAVPQSQPQTPIDPNNQTSPENTDTGSDTGTDSSNTGVTDYGIIPTPTNP